MTGPTRDLVDREELRRKLDQEEGWSDPSTLQGRARREGIRTLRRFLDAMPAVECPRGWTRDEVLHEMDTHPGAVCEVQNPHNAVWEMHHQPWIRGWHPEVRRYDVRVVLPPKPVTVWVPLTKLVGRTLKGCRWPVAVPPIYDTDGERWVWSSTGSIERFPDGTLNLETGMVEVLAEGDA